MSKDECYSQSFIFIPDSQVHAICMSQCRKEQFKTSFIQVIMYLSTGVLDVFISINMYI